MKRLLFILISFVMIHNSHAWTASHQRLLEELGKLVPYLDKLPATNLESLHKVYSLYPDNNVSIPLSIVGQEGTNYLKEYKIHHTAALHNAEAMPHMFYLLVKALRARNYNAAVFWIGCISHNLNDSASPHFLPSQYTLSQLSQNFNLKVSDSEFLEKADKPIIFLEALYNNPVGAAELKKLKSSYKYSIISEKPQEVYEYISTLPIYLRNASFKHSQFLMDSYQRNLFTDSKEFLNGNIAVARMGTIGIKATADVINTAWEFARRKIKIKPEDLDYAIISDKINKLIKKRSLGDLPLFKDVLPRAQSGKIGILTESYYRFEESALGYASRYLAASMMGTLKKAKIDFRALDLKNYLEKDLPSPDIMPILVVPACEITSGFRFIKKRHINNMLNKYTDAGGRILLISSNRASFVGDLSFKLKIEKDESIFENEFMKEASIQYNDILTTPGDADETNKVKVKSMLYKTLPKNFGWMRLSSQLLIAESDNITPLAFCKIDEDTFTLGGYLQREDAPKKAQFVTFSNRAFYPYLLSNKLLSVSQPRLDEVTEPIFLKSLELLK